MRPTNQPTITGLALCHRKVGDVWCRRRAHLNLTSVKIIYLPVYMIRYILFTEPEPPVF